MAKTKQAQFLATVQECGLEYLGGIHALTLDKWAGKLPTGTTIEISVKVYNPRTLQQVRYYFGAVLPHIRQCYMDAGIIEPLNRIKDQMMWLAFGKYELKPVGIDSSGVPIMDDVPVIMSHADLDKQQWIHLLEVCKGYSLQNFGVDLPDPEQYKLDKQFQNKRKNS